MTDTPDLIIANLDAETSWARRAGHSVRDLPAHVLERISLYGTLLRVLWPKATRLWTPVPVDRRCLRAAPGLQDVELVSGALRQADAADAGAWAMAPPWHGTDAQLDVAAEVNHRGFAHGLAVRLGVALPGSGIVRSRADLDRHIGPEARWVLKPPYGTAGRGFVFGSRTRFDDTHGLKRFERLLETHGQLLFEPWVERDLDVGRAIAPGFREARVHQLLTTALGRFRGIALDGDAALGQLASEQTALLATTAVAVVERLEDAGYAGPVGIDAFAHGHGRVQPLCEINARHTFGHVAHALGDRVAVPAFGRTDVTFEFGDRTEDGDPRVVPLVGSADGARMYAWLRGPK